MIIAIARAAVSHNLQIAKVHYMFSYDISYLIGLQSTQSVLHAEIHEIKIGCHALFRMDGYEH